MKRLISALVLASVLVGVLVSVANGSGFSSSSLPAASGTAAAPTINFTANTNRGFYNDTTNSGIGVAVGGAEVAFLSANPVIGIPTGIAANIPHLKGPTDQVLMISPSDTVAGFSSVKWRSSVSTNATQFYLMPNGTTGHTASNINNILSDIFLFSSDFQADSTNYSCLRIYGTNSTFYYGFSSEKAGTGTVGKFRFQQNTGSPDDVLVIDPAGKTLTHTSTCVLNWVSSSTDATGAADVQLARQGTGILGLSDGVTGCTFRVYNTTDAAAGSPTNFERFEAFWTGNTMQLQTAASGTGTVRGIILQASTQSTASTAGATVQVLAGTGNAAAGGDLTIVSGQAGSGTNLKSGDLTFKLAQSTGNATPTFTWQAPPTGSSGSGANTPVTVMSLTNAGLLKTVTIDASNATNTPVVKLNQGSFQPSNPTGTTSATGVMSGLGSTCSFTPRSSGRVLVIVSLNWASNATGSVVKWQVRHGTGAAPTNGAALTGTADGVLTNCKCTNGTDPVGGAATAFISGLSVGTAYWFDLSETSDGSSTANLTQIDYEIVEL